MYKNNNSNVVKKLAGRTSQANKTRNIFAVCAIILTTFMIATVFSIGISFARNYEIMTIRDSGTSAKMFLSKPTETQIEQVKDTEGVDDVGIQLNLGRIPYKDAAGKDSKIGMMYFDEVEWSRHYVPAIDRIKGEYPTKADEVMLSQAALKALGIDNPKVGMSIPLEYTDLKGSGSRDFILSGYFTNFACLSSEGSAVALLSKEFAEETGADVRNDGGIAISCGRDYRDVYDRLSENVNLRSGQKINTGFEVTDKSSGTQNAAVIVIVMIALFIVLSGYLLIYNIIYISVTRDIRFYGMLKTIGTSPSQIRKMVKSQIYRLSLIGIPVGLLLSIAVSFVAVPMVMKTFQGNSSVYGSLPGDISFNPVIFIGAAAFSFVTVAISCFRPARTAGKVSPIEALKYTGVNSRGKVKDRKTTNGGKLHKMAFHNVFREKKRAILVFASLFMGIITLLSVNGFLGSMDVSNYIERYCPHDFSYQYISGDNRFDDKFVESIRKVDGIKTVNATKASYTELKYDEDVYKPVIERWHERVASEESLAKFKSEVRETATKEYGTIVYELDKSYIEKYNDTHKDKVDLESFEKGESIIVSGEEDDKSMIGKEITMKGRKGDMEITRKVDAVFTGEDADLNNYSTTVGAPEGIYISSALMDKLAGDAKYYYIDIDVKPGETSNVNTKLNNMKSSLDGFEYAFTSKIQETAIFDSTMITMKVLGGGISVLLIFIGIINFINVMMTGVFARRKELAVLESVGMSNRQVKKMLTLEGVYYAVITMIITMTLGNGVLYFIAKTVPEIADYAVFHYPVVLVAALAVCVFAICTIVPKLVYNFVSRESITERLREAD